MVFVVCFFLFDACCVSLVGWGSLCGVCCSLFDAGCGVFAACCLPRGACCLAFAVWRLLFAVLRLMSTGWYWLLVVCCTMYIVRRLLCAAC